MRRDAERDDEESMEDEPRDDGDEPLRIGRHGAQEHRPYARVRDPAMRHVVRAFVWPHDVLWSRRAGIHG